MIKLKSGKVVQFDENFDLFFQNLLSELIQESMSAAEKSADRVKDLDAYNKVLLKELMDNSIFVTHQIFDLAKVNKNLSKFLVTGFLFNSIVLSIPDLSQQFLDRKANEDTIH